jgi:hypothetical protein
MSAMSALGASSAMASAISQSLPGDQAGEASVGLITVPVSPKAENSGEASITDIRVATVDSALASPTSDLDLAAREAVFSQLGQN